MQFRILGPLEVVSNGDSVRIEGAKQSAESAYADASLCIELGREHARTIIEAWGWLYQGKIHARWGEYERALDRAEEAKRLAGRLDPINRASVNSSFGYRLADCGRWEEARPVLEEAVKELERVGATSTQPFGEATWAWRRSSTRSASTGGRESSGTCRRRSQRTPG